MARSRNIKPGIMANELLGDLDPVERLLFIYLWMLADKEGRLEDRPKRIKAEALPYDDADVDAMLSRLQQAGFIFRYTEESTRVIQILKFSEHQAPHVREKASTLPMHIHVCADVEPCTEKAKPMHGQGSALASPRSPDVLIPDSLIPDVLIPDCGFTDSKTLTVSDESQPAADEPQAEKQKPKSKPTGETDHQIACRRAWDSYSAAYFDRYRVNPVRNAKVNSQIKQLVLRLGAEESPPVAAFFVSINDSFYIRSSHELGLLLAKAEGIRTQWVTGRQMNGRTARQLEDTQANINAAQEAATRLRAKGEVKKNAFL